MSETVHYINGNIFTGDPMRPHCTRISVRDGHIIDRDGNGGRENLEALGQVVDLGGRRVIPGLVDPHMHALLLATLASEIPLTMPDVQSIEDIRTRVAQRRQTVQSGEWITGLGYDEGKLRERRAPTRQDLDAVAKDVPVLLVRACGHMGVANRKALALAGIGRSTPDPEGGQIDRDADGEPTGILREKALFFVLARVPRPARAKQAALLHDLAQASYAVGLTRWTDLWAGYHPHDDAEAYVEARRTGTTPPVSLFYIWDQIREVAGRPRPKDYPEWGVNVGGIKMVADGSVSGRTAWVAPSYQPYQGRAGDSGLPQLTPEDLLEGARTAEAWGVQLAVHAMGEAAIAQVVETFHGRAGWLVGRPSIRIEHAALPSADLLRQMAESGMAMVPQPIFLYAEIESYLNHLGRDRTARSYPLASALRAGVYTALSSDAPATAWKDPANPWLGIYSAVTRRAYDGTDTGSAERIPVSQALSLYTRQAARLLGIQAGVLAPGFAADFAVLNEDVLAVEPERLLEPYLVAACYQAGQPVFGQL